MSSERNVFDQSFSDPNLCFKETLRQYDSGTWMASSIDYTGDVLSQLPNDSPGLDKQSCKKGRSIKAPARRCLVSFFVMLSSQK